MSLAFLWLTLVDGHVDCFYFLTNRNNADTNICMQAFAETHSVDRIGDLYFLQL